MESFRSVNVNCSDAEQQADPSDDPLGWLLLGLEVEGPDKRGATAPSLVYGTLVHILRLLLVDRDSLDEHDRHVRGKVFQVRLLDQTGLRVPSSSLHEETMDVRPFPGRTTKVLAVLFGDVTLQAHLVQRPLVPTSHRLHDGCEEGLGVEKPCKPDACWHVEVAHPVLELSDTQQEVCVPCRQSIHRWVGSLGPAVGNGIEEQSVLQALHF